MATAEAGGRRTDVAPRCDSATSEDGSGSHSGIGAARPVLQQAVVAPPSGRRARSRRIVITAAAAAAAAVLGIALLALVVDGRSGEAAGERRTAQPVTEYPPAERGVPVSLDGRDLAGDAVSTGALRGSPLVLNVWGSWCAPCRTEAPVLRAVSAEYADRGVQFLGLNVKDNPAAAVAFERRFDITYPSLDDRSGRATLALSEYLPASVVPATLVLDRQGRVAARVLGAVEASTLRSLLDTVVSEP